MIAPFIPYFIAANLATDTSSWLNGPEYVFTANFNLYLETEKFTHDNMNLTAIMDIRCQPKGNDTLTCAVKMTGQTAYDGSVLPETNDDITNQFEAIFDSSGIVGIKTSKSVSPFQRVVLRRIASLFSVGVNISQTDADSLDTMTENSLLGKCEDTEVQISVHDPSGNPEHLDGQSYDLYPTVSNKNQQRMNLVINKNRDPTKCSATDSAFFFIFAPYPITITESSSKITVSDTGRFTSSTRTRCKFNITVRNEMRVVSVEETLQVALLRVEEATESIPVIPNFKIVPIEISSPDTQETYEH